MKIAITGSTGLIGSHLVADLTAAGHTVVRMVRHDARGSDILWRPQGPLDPGVLTGVNAVVHLAGEPIGSGRWTDSKKRRIHNSRVDGTTTIAEAVAAADGGPSVLVSASAIGLYGDRGDQVISEETPAGEDFLAKVVVAWETAADPARHAGVRVVHPRTGIVLDPDGGALRSMLPLFKLGLGGRMGSGRQWWSWVAMADVVGLIRWALETDGAAGPYNVTAPNPVTNAAFTRTLAAVLGRPSLLTVPEFAPKLVLGELAEALLFHSQRVHPVRAQADGYDFGFTALDPALSAILSDRAGSRRL